MSQRQRDKQVRRARRRVRIANRLIRKRENQRLRIVLSRMAPVLTNGFIEWAFKPSMFGQLIRVEEVEHAS